MHPRLLDIVDVGITIPEPRREMTLEETQDLYHIAQAASVILSSWDCKEDLGYTQSVL